MDKRIVFSIVIAFLVIASLLFAYYPMMGSTGAVEPSENVSREEVIEEEEDDEEDIERTRIRVERDSDLEELISKLNTSEKLLGYLNEDLSIVQEPIDDWAAKHPKQLIADGQGNQVDILVFSAFVLQENGYESGLMRYRYRDEDNSEEKENIVVPFRDTDVPKYIFIDDGEVRMSHHGWSFEEMFSDEEERLDIVITEYATFLPRYLELYDVYDRPEWVER